MTQFDDREKAFEQEFIQQGERAFKLLNRRNKLFGLEIANRLSFSSEHANSFASTVVTDFLEHRSDDTLVSQALEVLSAAQHKTSTEELSSLLLECHQTAVQQLSE